MIKKGKRILNNIKNLKNILDKKLEENSVSDDDDDNLLIQGLLEKAKANRTTIYQIPAIEK